MISSKSCQGNAAPLGWHVMCHVQMLFRFSTDTSRTALSTCESGDASGNSEAWKTPSMMALTGSEESDQLVSSARGENISACYCSLINSTDKKGLSFLLSLTKKLLAKGEQGSSVSAQSSAPPVSSWLTEQLLSSLSLTHTHPQIFKWVMF